MQLFNVKTPAGGFVMNAPMETIRWVYKIPIETMVRVLNDTQRLGAQSELHFRVPIGGQMSVLIERLPLEIPRPPAAGIRSEPDLPTMLIGASGSTPGDPAFEEIDHVL
jgi:hypothetical protein